MHSSFAIAAFLSAVSAVHAANTVVQVGAGGAVRLGSHTSQIV